MTPQQRLNAVLNGGYWARMCLLERGVWLVLYGRSDFESGVVQLAMASIARLAGVTNLHRTRLAVEAVETQGLVRKVRDGGGRNNPAVYQLLCPPPLPGAPFVETGPESDLFAADKTGPLTGPVCGETREVNRAGERHKQGRSAHLNRAGERAQTGPVSGPPFIGALNSPPPSGKPPAKTGPVSGPVTTGTEEEEEFFQWLVAGERGVWKPSAWELIHAGLTWPEARAIWAGVVNETQNLQQRKNWFFHRVKKQYLQPTFSRRPR